MDKVSRMTYRTNEEIEDSDITFKGNASLYDDTIRKYLEDDDDRTKYDFLYEHFTNYEKNYLKDDMRIEHYNNAYKNYYFKDGDEFICFT